LRQSNDPKASKGIYDFYLYFECFTAGKIYPYSPKISTINKAVLDALADGSNEELKVKFNIAEYLTAKEAIDLKKNKVKEDVADQDSMIAKNEK
jgi:hypothetical protein